MKIKLGISPCPNDTYIFGAWINKLVPSPFELDVDYLDIETLNERAMRNEFDVVKVSFHAVGALLEQYTLLNSGGALGRGCGPLVISKNKMNREELTEASIAIPGKWTTAALLMKLWCPQAKNLKVIPFHEIMPALRDGQVDAGVIIHESRFTYPEFGLSKVVDLGEWWESTTGHAIPLGGIMVRRDLEFEKQHQIQDLIRQSLEFATKNPDSISDYINSHAQEMAASVQKQHIELYVNEFSMEYGAEGRAAIEYLLTQAKQLELIPNSDKTIFLN